MSARKKSSDDIGRYPPPPRKRKQVKKACLNCRKTHSACDEARPCRRCKEAGVEDNCVDVPRRNKASKKQRLSPVRGETVAKPVRIKHEVCHKKCKEEPFDWGCLDNHQSVESLHSFDSEDENQALEEGSPCNSSSPSTPLNETATSSISPPSRDEIDTDHHSTDDTTAPFVPPLQDNAVLICPTIVYDQDFFALTASSLPSLECYADGHDDEAFPFAFPIQLDNNFNYFSNNLNNINANNVGCGSSSSSAQHPSNASASSAPRSYPPSLLLPSFPFENEISGS